MSAFPDWFQPLTGGPGPAADTFEAIERRIRGGMLMGLGLVFVARTTLRPWSVTIASVLLYVLVGAFVVGMLLTPPDVFSQTLLAIPMYCLFEVGVFFARFYTGKRLTRDDDAAAEAEAAEHREE